MRAVFVAMIIAGFSLALGYPWYVNNFTGSEIGRWPLLESRNAGFITQEIPLAASEVPIRVLVEAVPLAGYIPAQRRSALTLAVSRDGFPLLSEGLDFVTGSTSVNTDRPQDGTPLRQSAGDIDPVIAGVYAFRAVQGNTDGLQLSKVSLILSKGAEVPNETYTTFGLIIGVLGVYALMRTRLRQPRL